MKSANVDPKPTPRWKPTPVIVLGLTGAITIAVWIGILAASVPPTRARLHNGIVLLTALNEFEAALEELERSHESASDAEGAKDPARLIRCADAIEAALAEVDQAGRLVIEEEVHEHLAALRGSTMDMLLTLRAMASATDDQASADLNRRFENSKTLTEHSLRSTNAAIHQHRAHLSSLLIDKWRQVVVLAGAAVLLAVCFAVAMLLRVRSSALHHARTINEIHESREQFRLLAENLPGVIYLCKNDERFTMMFISKSVEHLTGYDHADFVSNRVSFVDLFHPEDAPRVAPTVDAAVAAGKPYNLDYRLQRRDGSWRWIEEIGVGVYRKGKLAFLEGFIYDVTERREAERKLVEQREFLGQVIDLNPNLIFAKDREGRFTLVNRALAEMYGTTVEGLTNKTDADFNTNAEEVANFRRDDLEVMQFGEKIIPEEVVTDSHGRVHWVRTHKRPIVNEEGVADQVLGVATDITDLKRAERIRSGRNEVLECIATGAPLEKVLDTLAKAFQDALPSHVAMVTLLVPDGDRFQLVAAPGMNAHLRTQLQDSSPEELLHCGIPDGKVHRTIVTDLTAQAELNEAGVLLHSGGFRSCWSEPIRSEAGEVLGSFAFFGAVSGEPEDSDIEIMQSAAKIAAIAIQRDRADKELRESQARLRAADRLAAIGTLTAGLGHDMNNVLFPLQCRLDSIDWQRIPSELEPVLRSTRETMNYLHELTEGLRSVAADADRADSRGGVTHIEDWWQKVAMLIHDAIPRDIKLNSRLEPNLPPIAVAPHRLTQAILNLVVNAAEATDDSSPINVWARRSADEEHVEIGVTDRGCGITDEDKTRVLDPFFTTKTRALSTGLGLSLVHGVVTGASGSIDIDSTPGQGTTITLKFPVAKRPLTAPETARTAVVALTDSRTAGWVSSILANEGYNVMRVGVGEVPDGDLWITEPTAKNLEIAREFLERSPRPRVIVLGVAQAAWRQPGVTVVKSSEDLSSIRSAVQRTLQNDDSTHHAK